MDLRIKDLASKTSALDRYLSERFGYAITRDGNDWIISEKDRALRRGPRPVLTLRQLIELKRENCATIAATLSSFVPTDFEKYERARPKEPTRISDGVGVITDLDACMHEVFLVDRDELPGVIERGLLPLMIEKFGMTHATACTIDAPRQQAHVSLAALSTLISAVGLDETKVLREQRGVLDSIMLSNIDPLLFTQAFMVFNPLVIALPVNRLGCIWYFFRPKPFVLRRTIARGVIDHVVLDTAPRVDGASIFGLRGLEAIDADDIWRFLRFVIDGINRLMIWANDLRSFQRATGEVDFKKQVRVYCAIRLLFADLLNIVCSMSAHTRIGASFSVLDKLANLKVGVSAADVSEADLMMRLASVDQGKVLRESISGVAFRYSNTLADALGRTVTECFHRVHDDLAREIGLPNPLEIDRLRLLRAHRNLHHGPFFRDATDFDRLFMRAEGHVPEDLATLAYVLMLGLVTSPAEFIGYQATAMS